MMEGQRVLLVAPRFFGYENEIASELTRRGAHVDMLRDRPFDTPLMAAVTRFRREWVIKFADRFYRNELHRLGRASYDLIFVVNGQTLSEDVLAELRSVYPRARFVLYMWDSIENRKSVVGNLKFFDNCFSFDPVSSREYGLRFRPLFFSPGFAKEASENFDFHLSFVGTAHSDRWAVASSIESSLRGEIRCYWYLYLQAPWVYWAYKILNPTFRNSKIRDFQFRPLEKREVQSVFSRSRAILDIEHPRQTGLTMRTLETVGASKKLVTTNSHVRDCDFFCHENVCVIDRHKPVVSAEFLEAPYKPLSQEIYAKYSLAGWLNEILLV